MMQQVQTESLMDGASPLPKGKLGYEAFLQWTEGRHAEWVDGEVFLMGPASGRHPLLVKFLLKLLDEYVETYGLGLVLFAPFQMRLDLTRTGREPDVLFIAQEHLDRYTETFLNGPADLAIEVVSPESQERDRVVKHGEYARGGVREYWIIDPDRQEALFYQIDASGSYVLTPSDAEGVFHSTAVRGLFLPVAWLWQEPLPAMRSVREFLGL